MPQVNFTFDDVDVSIQEEDCETTARELDVVEAILQFRSDVEFRALLPLICPAIPIEL